LLGLILYNFIEILKFVESSKLMLNLNKIQ
jgi:hypothetical protein